MKIKFLSLLLFLLTLCAFSEDFRVKNVQTIDWSDETESHTINLGMMEALHVDLAENRYFLEAIEMEISLPENVAEHGPAIAYTFYKDVSPEPTSTEIDYSASKINLDTFAYRKSYHFTIPVSKNYKKKVDPYTTNIDLPFDFQLEDIFMRLHIIMKGIPDALYDSFVTVTLKPVFNNKGLLDLSVLYPEKITENFEDYPYLVFIDEEPIDFTGEPVLLDKGQHHLAVSSDDFRNNVQTFDISRATVTNIDVQLQDIVPLIKITCPKDTVLQLNDMQYDDFTNPIEVTPGTHNLVFTVGDYEILRTIDVVNARTYNVRLDFDITVTEE